MKRIVVLLVAFVLVVGVSFARTASEELETAKEYLKTLDAKIAKYKEMKGAKAEATLEDLRGQKTATLEKIKRLKAAVEAEAAKTVAPKKTGPRGFAVKAGLIGGAGTAAIGYYFPVRAVDIGVYAGYGIGKNYNVMVAQLEGVFKLAAFNLIPSIDYADYSVLVKNLPGLSGDTAKGAHSGLGLALGKEFSRWDVRLGYSTALGLTATLGTRF